MPSSEDLQAFYKAANLHLDHRADSDRKWFLNFGIDAPHLRTAPRVQERMSKVVDALPFLPDLSTINSILMLLLLVDPIPVVGARILEVGCGRGGNLFALDRVYSPTLITGVDLCKEAIDQCRRLDMRCEAHWRVADATALPFLRSSFDIILNIESAHCYSHPLAFLREVHRILAPGGTFIYADLVEPQMSDAFLAGVCSQPFEVLEVADITTLVSDACREVLAGDGREFGNHPCDNRQAYEAVLTAMTDGSLVYRTMRATTRSR